MNLPTAGFRLTKFVVVESLESHEVKTGKLLADQLQTLVSEHAPELDVEYITCENVIEFRQILANLTQEAKERKAIPVLHVECHGSTSEGLEFANGSSLGWVELASILTELNIATEFNLLAVLSACFGGYLLGEISAITPAAFWCIVAPTLTIDPADAMRGFRIFYRTLFVTGDAGIAATQLVRTRLTEGEWFAQLAQLWFERLVLGYVETHCTPKAARTRATGLYRRLRANGQSASIGGLIRQLKQRNRSDLTGKYFDIFFCTERVPSAANRFAAVRERVHRKLATLRTSGRYVI